MPRLVLKSIGNGMDTVYEVPNSVANKMIADGKAIMLPDGIVRELEAPAKKVEAEYKTKDMKPKKKATKKG